MEMEEEINRWAGKRNHKVKTEAGTLSFIFNFINYNLIWSILSWDSEIQIMGLSWLPKTGLNIHKKWWNQNVTFCQVKPEEIHTFSWRFLNIYVFQRILPLSINDLLHGFSENMNVSYVVWTWHILKMNEPLIVDDTRYLSHSNSHLYQHTGAFFGKAWQEGQIYNKAYVQHRYDSNHIYECVSS